jgi:hypothetical protein
MIEPSDVIHKLWSLNNTILREIIEGKLRFVVISISIGNDIEGSEDAKEEIHQPNKAMRSCNGSANSWYCSPPQTIVDKE